MPRSREERRARLMEKAERLIEEHLDWADSTPRPTLTQIEEKVLELRRELGQMLARDLIEEQEAKQPAVGPRCPECGGEMRYKGQKRVRPQTWVGDVEIERGHYYCPECRASRFPPG